MGNIDHIIIITCKFSYIFSNNGSTPDTPYRGVDGEAHFRMNENGAKRKASDADNGFGFGNVDCAGNVDASLQPIFKGVL